MPAGAAAVAAEMSFHRVVVLGSPLAAASALAARLDDALALDDPAELVRRLPGLPQPLCLLLAPDLSAPAALRQEQEEADARMRSALAALSQSFQVIHGADDAERLANALRALRAVQPRARNDAPARPWVWSCEKCSDAQCEHQLFRRLTDATGG